MSKYTEDDLKIELENKEYEYGFYTEPELWNLPSLNEDMFVPSQKKENHNGWPIGLEAFRAWEQMIEPEWANVATKPEGYILLFSSKAVDLIKHDVDPELCRNVQKS
jgi:Fe-S cluster assembly protein SufB